MKRNIILNLAISLDGYIADEDGGFAWIKGDGNTGTDTEEKFDFPAFVESIDTIVMGKNAYVDCPSATLVEFASKKILVATTKGLTNTSENVECINGDVCQVILDLRENKGKDIWLWGGAGLTDAFIKADIIDRYIIGIIPIILGKGRPLFLEDNPTINLKLAKSTSQEGIIILEYVK